MRGHLIDVNSKSLRDWRRSITLTAIENDARILEGAVEVTLDFYVPRPKGHFGKKGLLPSAPPVPRVRPDVDKLARAVLDALTGTCFRDDAQVAELHARKRYADDGPGSLSGLWIQVEELG